MEVLTQGSVGDDKWTTSYLLQYSTEELGAEPKWTFVLVDGSQVQLVSWKTYHHAFYTRMKGFHAFLICYLRVYAKICCFLERRISLKILYCINECDDFYACFAFCIVLIIEDTFVFNGNLHARFGNLSANFKGYFFWQLQLVGSEGLRTVQPEWNAVIKLLSWSIAATK